MLIKCVVKPSRYKLAPGILPWSYDVPTCGLVLNPQQKLSANSAFILIGSNIPGQALPCR